MADPLSRSALATSCLAIPFWLFAAPHETTGDLSAYTFWLAAIWFTLSFLHRLTGLFTAAQLMLSLGVLLGVTAVLKRQDWYAATPHPLVDPWTLQAQGIALAVLSLAWVVGRVSFRRTAGIQYSGPSTQYSVPSTEYSGRSTPYSALGDRQAVVRDTRLAITSESVISTPDWRGTLARLLYPPWPPLDRIVTTLVLFGLVALAAYGAAPGIMRELAARAEPGVPVWSIAGIPHTHAIGIGSWILLTLVVTVLVASLWERFDVWIVHAIMLALAMACPLWAGRWGPEVATASALRWCTAAFFMLASLPLWFRAHVARLVAALDWPEMKERCAGLARESRTLLLVLAVMPALALTLYPAAVTLAGHPIVDVAPSSFFGQIGKSISYVVPLAVIFVALVGHAVRERSAGFAFSAGLVLNLTVTLGYLLWVVTSGYRVGAAEWVRLIQFNAIATAAFALAWLNSRSWLLRTFTGAEPESAGWLLRLQVASGLVLNLIVLWAAEIRLFVNPATPATTVTEAGSLFGWLAMASAVGAAIWLGRTRGQKLNAVVVCASVVAIGSVVSFSISRWNAHLNTPPIPWLGYHALLASRAAAAWIVLAMGWLAVRGRRASGRPPLELIPYRGDTGQTLSGIVRQFAVERWTVVLAVLTVILALRAAIDRAEPGRPWWAAGALVSTSLLMAGLARFAVRRAYLYAAGLLFNLAASIWWVIEFGRPQIASVIEFGEVNVIALALPGFAWLALELQVFRHGRLDEPRRRPVPFHHLAAIGSLLGIAGMVGMGLFADSVRAPIRSNVLLGWTSLASAGAIMLACLWDSAARYAVAGLYVLGLVAVGMAVDQSNLSPHQLGWYGALILAAYSVATSYLWSQRERLRAVADALRVPRHSESPLAGQVWLLSANQLLAAAVVVLAYWIVLTYEEYPLRLAAAKAATAQALAVGLLAQGTRRPKLQRIALLLVVVGAVAWGWAWLEPGMTGNLLNRAVVVLTVLSVMSALYGLGLGKFLPRETEWTRAALGIVPHLLVLAGVSLVFVLVSEVVQWSEHQKVEMGPAAIAAIIAALAALCVAAIVAALVPGRDPLSLSERGRMTYVYAAEALAGLLFMHARLTMPWLFEDWFMRYWTLIVLALAFLGTGLSEIFRRQNRLVLAEPLERSGAFLPILPVMSLWILPSEVHYSQLLVAIGFLYGALSVTRKSFGFGMLAAIASNGGLWYYLNHMDGYGLLDHPQLWLIPAALSVLAAAYLNREQLEPEQFVVIRYLTIMTVYVSSTAEIFIRGVKDDPWLPMVLAGLSVAGILAGMLMRVRSFLFLGSSFLVLSLVTMIRSAQVNLEWTWLWWVAGIALGVLIITVFAVFEKKRKEVLMLVEGLKEWER